MNPLEPQRPIHRIYRRGCVVPKRRPKLREPIDLSQFCGKPNIFRRQQFDENTEVMGLRVIDSACSQQGLKNLFCRLLGMKPQQIVFDFRIVDPFLEANWSWLAFLRSTLGRSGGIEHLSLGAGGPLDRARLRGPLLEFRLADEQDIHRHGQSGESPIELDQLLIPVGDVPFDDHQIHVASRIGVATGPRTEQNDPRRTRYGDDARDGGLHLFGGRDPRRIGR